MEGEFVDMAHRPPHLHQNVKKGYSKIIHKDPNTLCSLKLNKMSVKITALQNIFSLTFHTR